MPKTFSPKPAEIERRWYLVDADGMAVGRLSTQIARLLSGKNKPIYAPHVDCGDFVIVINAAKVVLSGTKETTKVYYRHRSTRPGGLKAEKAGDRRRRAPAKLIEDAVSGMLPKNSLGRRMRRKLKVYRGADHPHQAQKPEALVLQHAAGQRRMS